MYPPIAYYPPPVYYGQAPLSIEARMERKSLRRIGNLIGWAFVISQVSVQVLIIVLSLVLRELSLGWVLEDPMVSLLLQFGLSILMFVPPFMIVARRLRPRGSAAPPIFQFKKPPVKISVAVVALGLGLAGLGNIATGQIAQLLGILGIPLEQSDFSLPGGPFGSLMFVLTISAVPALVEEFALRGVVMGALRPYSHAFALVASSVMFGAMHGNFVQAPFAFVGGLGMGFAALATGSIWPAVIIHFINNLLSVLLSMLPEQYANLANYSWLMLTLLLGVVGLALLLKWRPAAFSIKGQLSALPAKGKAKAFFLSPGIVVANVVFLLEALLAILLSLLG